MSFGKPEQEKDAGERPETDGKLEVGNDMDSDEDEEEIKKWLSTTYERGSRKPMKEPLMAFWGLPISDADLDKLKTGFKSKSMDDKWDILIEEPDKDGNISVHIIRNWFQEECYILHIIPNPVNGHNGSAKIQSITWEGNKAGLQCNAEQAEKEAVMLCRGHLHCEFKTLPHYPTSMFWDPSAYKRLAAE